MNGAFLGIGAAALLALTLGFLARRGQQMGLGQWTVADRSFGAPLVFLLMAGEIYTTFTFLGGSGFAYGRGGPVYYILCYATLAYVIIQQRDSAALRVFDAGWRLQLPPSSQPSRPFGADEAAGSSCAAPPVSPAQVLRGRGGRYLLVGR